MEETIARNSEGQIIQERFTKKRTGVCAELMRPEVKPLLNLSLDDKIKKSKEIIEAAIKIYPKIGLGFSGGTDSVVLLDLVLPFHPHIPVIFVDTQHEFPKTYKYIEDMKFKWNLNLRTVKAEQNRFEEFKRQFGLKTPKFTETCCYYHKIAPMMKAIQEFKFDAFFVGLRGVEHEERAKESVFSRRETHIRIHPLLFWTKEDILEYVRTKNIDCNPIYEEGYTSLGCTHCTEKNPDPNAHERAGRGIVREEIMQKLRELGYT